jgi:hypothetical protein
MRDPAAAAVLFRHLRTSLVHGSVKAYFTLSRCYAFPMDIYYTPRGQYTFYNSSSAGL